jgi:hypothetical protein
MIIGLSRPSLSLGVTDEVGAAVEQSDRLAGAGQPHVALNLPDRLGRVFGQT